MRWKAPKKIGEPSACVAAILAPGWEVLLIRRAERADDPWSGHMALPGGRREACDADALATAVRETREETGIDLSAAEHLGELDDLSPRVVNRTMIVRPFVFRFDGKPAVGASDEVAGHLWVRLRDLPPAAGRTEVTISGRVAEVDAFLIGPSPIWGLTHRILSGLLERVPRSVTNP